MILLYQLLLLLASPVLIAWVAARSLVGRMPGLAERLGFFPRDSHGNIPRLGGPRVWLHAVSLGEVKLALAIAAELRQRIPSLEVVYTTSTATGQQEARRGAGPGDTVLFPPIDLAWICRRFLRHIAPTAIIIVETELWPNLFRQAWRAEVPLYIVNGRISDRSWPRYRATAWFWRSVLSNVSRVFASSATDAARFSQLGLPSVPQTGNLKFRIQPAARESDFLRAAASQLKRAPQIKVIVAGSTMPGEESILIEAFRTLQSELPALWMILAPRHPERFAEAEQLLRGAGITVARRSQWRDGAELATRGVLLLDTIGELASAYQLCDVAFVGGTLVPTGGHNILEPAAAGKPIVTGHSMENFREIAELFLAADSRVKIPVARVGGIVQVAGASELLATLRHLLTHPADAAQVGACARHVYLSNQENGGKVIAALAEAIQASRRTPSQRVAARAAT